MKKLTNTSPFLLLLVPVFFMIILTFAVSSNDAKNEDLASKTRVSTGNFIKIINPFAK